MAEVQSELEGRFTVSGADIETKPAKQRRYSAAYKQRLIGLADACTAPGELASLLRREGIYASTLSDFRKQMLRGDLDRKAGSSRATKTSAADTQASKDLAASERENRKLRRDLEKARLMLDLQKKVSELLGISLDQE